MVLTETPRYQAWLAQFDPEDRDTAELLASALVLVSDRDFRGHTQEILSARVADLNASGRGPVALYPAFDVDALDGDGTPRYFACNGENQPLPTALGSEGPVAYLCTQLERKFDGMVLNRPTVERLRKCKARTILVVNDLLGSGDQAAGFIEAMIASKVARAVDGKAVATLRSWHSYGWIRFEVVAYGATEQAVQRVESCLRSRPAVTYWRRAELVGPEWTAETHRRVRELCKRYAQTHKRRSVALGYGGACTGLVLAHKCPNTVPFVLAGHSRMWRGLFGRQGTIPADLLGCFGEPSVAQPNSLALAGYRRIQQREWGQLRSEEAEHRLRVLDALRRHVRTRTRFVAGTPTTSFIATVEKRTGLPRSVCVEVVGWCVKHGLLCASGQLTDAAIAVLEHCAGQRARCVKEPGLKLGNYFDR